MATFDEFLGSLEVDFGEANKGKKFEVFCKWFLENDPEWSKTIETVWLWDDYPHKWQRQDLGTDLVFRDNEGQIWAVQAKCFSEHRTTTKGDMNSFLADTGRKEVHRRLWLQTTNKMEAKAEKTLKGQDKPVTVFMLNDFRNAQIDYPSSFSELYKAKVKQKPRPDPHQLEAIANVKLGLQSQDRGQMIMACGTGKTFTTLWIKEALEAHNTLVLLPSLSLLSQTMREWAWAGNTDFDILNVCSDQSVGKKTEDMDPADAPFPVTSDVHEIAAFLQKESSKVIFCTYQSSDLIAQAQREETVPIIDLAIADEAHRCAGKADAGFATILDSAKIRAKKRLFTTATPRYFGGVIKDAAKDRDLEVIGMDNQTVFGPVIHKLTFGQAIANDLLTDYQVVIVGVDEPMVKEWIDNYEIVTTGSEKETDARTLAAKIGLIKAIKDYDLKRVISFHSRVKGAKDFAEEFIDVVDHIEPSSRPDGLFLTDYVSGEMKAGDRKEKIDKLKALDGYGRGILTNARCLAEGVDVPSLDGVAFIDPKGSKVEIIQAVGRAIRKVRGVSVQKKGTIVLPVFIEAGDDPEIAIEASNFKPVWDVLNALRAHDDVLADTLDQYRTNMAKNASQNREQISDKVIFDMPTSVGVEFSAALRTVIVEATTAPWEFCYGLLENFKVREGHCLAPRGHLEFDFNLGNWVSRQRHNKETLSNDRIKRLETIGFSWDPFFEQWEKGYSALKKYYSREGHSLVPTKHNEEGFNLGGWVDTQRTNKRSLSKNNLDRLNALGFIWNALDEKWEVGFRALQNFYEREGHSNVPQTLEEDGFRLGIWLNTVRAKKDILSKDRLDKLEKLELSWGPREQKWERGFIFLKKFYIREGHCFVPQRHIEEGYNLRAWVDNQRNTNAVQSEDRLNRLKALGFTWNTFDQRWDEGFSHLQNYHDREGHSRVATNHIENGFNLGLWVSSQRSNKATQTSARTKKLQSLGFVWDALDEKWEEGFRALQKFYDREGHCLVPNGYEMDGKKLAKWVSHQRTSIDTITEDRFNRLLALGFSWDPLKDKWEEGFRALQKFHGREGHCLVPKLYSEGSYNLGNWVNKQRSKKLRLQQDRITLLDELGFSWNTKEEKK
jgi:superfamily II DNA or RNA helicase